MNLFQSVAILFVVSSMTVGSHCQDQMSEGESSLDGSCPTDKESCGCDQTNRPVTVDAERLEKLSTGDVSTDDILSTKPLSRPENVDFPRKNQMAFIKGKNVTWNRSFALKY